MTDTAARLKRLLATRDALLVAIENLAVEIAVTMQEGEPLPIDAPERSQPRHKARLFKGEGFGPDWGASE